MTESGLTFQQAGKTVLEDCRHVHHKLLLLSTLVHANEWVLDMATTVKINASRGVLITRNVLTWVVPRFDIHFTERV